MKNSIIFPLLSLAVTFSSCKKDYQFQAPEEIVDTTDWDIRFAPQLRGENPTCLNVTGNQIVYGSRSGIFEEQGESTFWAHQMEYSNGKFYNDIHGDVWYLEKYFSSEFNKLLRKTSNGWEVVIDKSDYQDLGNIFNRILDFKVMANGDIYFLDTNGILKKSAQGTTERIDFHTGFPGLNHVNDARMVIIDNKLHILSTTLYITTTPRLYHLAYDLTTHEWDEGKKYELMGSALNDMSFDQEGNAFLLGGALYKYSPKDQVLEIVLEKGTVEQNNIYFVDDFEENALWLRSMTGAFTYENGQLTDYSDQIMHSEVKDICIDTETSKVWFYTFTQFDSRYHLFSKGK